MKSRVGKLPAQFVFLMTTLSVYAQSSSKAPTNFSHDEIVFAMTSFFDFGPPFDYYTLYRLTAASGGTDVEKIAVTPPASSCTLPTTEVSHAHIQEKLSKLFDDKDPCRISEKASRREAKRCKHCLTFSGIHASVQLSCGEKTRVIRYEVLDRDLFDTHPKTPNATLHTTDLIGKLDSALGGGNLDRPVFTIDEPSKHQADIPKDAAIEGLARGAYDSLFSESISDLYKDSLQTPNLPLIQIASISTELPIEPALPKYPPIARAAHVGGSISMNLKVSPDGKVSDMSGVSGPLLLQGATIDAARSWQFASSPNEHTETVKIDFNLNCPSFLSSSPSAGSAAPSAH